MIEYTVTFTDKNLRKIAEGLLDLNGIEAEDLRMLKTNKTKVIDSLVADRNFNASLLKTLKRELSFKNLYDAFPFEDDMDDVDIVKHIRAEINDRNEKERNKSNIERARDLLIQNGYTVNLLVDDD